MPLNTPVYKTFIISTIVDVSTGFDSPFVYKTFVIWLIGENIVPLHYEFLKAIHNKDYSVVKTFVLLLVHQQGALFFQEVFTRKGVY